MKATFRRAVTLSLVLLISGCASIPRSSDSLQEKMRGKSVLLVFAHPDDETMMSGALGRLKEFGLSLDAIYMTRGEGGKINLITGDASDLRRLRPQELKEAAMRIGFREVQILGEPDEPLRENGKPTKNARKFLAAKIWDRARIEAEIEKLCARTQPLMVLTLLPENAYTHAHHQSVGSLVKDLAERGRLGASVQEVWAVTESHWYPGVPFTAGMESEVIAFELDRRSEASRKTYAEFQAHAAAAHVSQHSGHQGVLTDEKEEFIPLWQGAQKDAIFKTLLK